MDRLRKAFFSGSWYPGNAAEVKKQLNKWELSLSPFEENICSGIVPHAGWFFSGMIAYDVIRRFSPELDILFILGGHLPENGPFLCSEESSYETPCGNLSIHCEALNYLKEKHAFQIENSPDNTVEVQLPFIRSLLGELPIVPIRVPAGSLSLEIVESIVAFSTKKNLKTAVLGSTDLTHYGQNYSFNPENSKSNPLEWVKDSDGKILQAMIDINPGKILEYAKENKSACSAGAAAGAALFARRQGSVKGEILAYDTSYSRHQSESFVGYGSVVYKT